MAWLRRPEAGVGARGVLALLALALYVPAARVRALFFFTRYGDPQTNLTVWSVAESGRFSDSSPKRSAEGLVGVPRAPGSNPEGCAPDTRFLVPGSRGGAPWIALVARGGCTFKDKVLVAARRNASAVVVYNEEQYGNITTPLSHGGERGLVGGGVAWWSQALAWSADSDTVIVAVGTGRRSICSTWFRGAVGRDRVYRRELRL
ncbi:E3 ubiquitin-protein ligase RNF149 [Tupaia chinensis]|uniref:E3 ubiquitin-protein ligase RNF149 n=1 Tax=Tupaia chinensis TaxID=246437 RepID=L8Y5P0_TUPCH|nr:E3 ubiquitin-protein ligase RNF149 [Tupaia chinensis]